jgi:hypothetical protein
MARKKKLDTEPVENAELTSEMIQEEVMQYPSGDPIAPFESDFEKHPKFDKFKGEKN